MTVVLVGAEGFEPPTLCSQSRCATRLRYAPIDSYKLLVTSHKTVNRSKPLFLVTYDL